MQNMEDVNIDVDIDIEENDDEYTTLQPYSSHAEIMRVLTKSKLTSYVFCRAFPLSEIFFPEETVYIQLFTLYKSSECMLYVYQNQNLISKDTVTTSQHGLGMYTLHDLPPGEYSVKMICDTFIESKIMPFRVAEYNPSMLYAEIESQKIIDSKKHVRIKLRHFPDHVFTGPVKVKLGMRYDSEILDYYEYDTEIIDGMCDIKIDEFILSIGDQCLTLIDGHGNTSLVKIIKSGEYGQSGVSLGTMLPGYAVYIGTIENAYAHIYGLSIMKKNASIVEEDEEENYYNPRYQDEHTSITLTLATPVIDAKEQTVQLVIETNTKNMKLLVQTYNILHSLDSDEHVFPNVENGSVVAIPVSPPVTYIFAYVINKNGEIKKSDFGAVFVNKEQYCAVSCSSKTEPGENIAVTITTNPNSDLFIMLYPKTTPVVYISSQISEIILNHSNIRNNYLSYISYDASYKKQQVVRSFLVKILEFISLVLHFILKPFLFLLECIETLDDYLTYRMRRIKEEQLALEQQRMREAALRAAEDEGFNVALSLEEKAKREQVSMLLHGVERLARKRNASIIYAQIVSVNEKEIINIEIPGIEDVGDLELYVFSLQDFGFTSEKKTITCDMGNRVMVHFPEIISATPGMSNGEISVQCEDESSLLVTRDTDEQTELETICEKTVHDTDTLPVSFNRPGKYQVALSRGKVLLDRFETNVRLLYQDSFVRSKLHILEPGEKLEGQSLWVYPSIHTIRKQTVEALYQYPHGCAEQILAGLYGNALLYCAFLEGIVVENETYNRIILKNRMKSAIAKIWIMQKKNFPGFYWGFYDKDSASIEITIQCLMHMQPFLMDPLLTDFPVMARIAQKTKHRLMKINVKDNRLLEIDDRFSEKKFRTPESAACWAIQKGDFKETISYLQQTAKSYGVGLAWEGNSIAGTLQTTITVARALYYFNSPLFYQAWVYISGEFGGDRFYSTSDTTEFLKLLFMMQERSGLALVDGRQVDLHTTDEMINATSVEAVDDELLVKEDYIETVNYLNVKSTINFTISEIAAEIEQFSSITIKIETENKNECLIARLTTTGGLASLAGSVQALKIEKPVLNGNVEFTLQALCKGKCELFVLVYDLYKAENIGVSSVITTEIV